MLLDDKVNFFGGKTEYEEKSHIFRNSIQAMKQRKQTDMVPIKYDDQADGDTWGFFAQAIVQPTGDEGKLFWDKTQSMKVEQGY